MSGGKRNKDYRCKDGRKLANAALCCMLSAFFWVAVSALFAQAAFAQTESMTTIAGSTAIPTGSCGSLGPVPLCNAGNAGNNGPANQAQLNLPYAVAVDGSGNFYIADGLNAAVREVNTSGTISIYMADPVAATTPGTAVTAVATDTTGGHIYWGDNFGNVYQDQSGTTLFALASSSIEALTTDSQGNLYVLAAGGDGTGPYQLSVITAPGTTSQQSFLIADTAGDTTFLGSRDVLFGVAAQYSPSSGSIPAQTIIYAFDNAYSAATGSPTPTLLELAVVWGTAGTPPAVSLFTSYSTAARAVYGQALAVDPVGNVYVDLGSAILKFTPGNPNVPVIAGTGTNGFNNGNNPNGDCCSVTNYYPYSLQPSPATATDINAVQGIFIDPNGVLYLADTQNNLVRTVSVSPGCQECGPTTLTLTDQIPKNSYSYALNPVTHKLYVVFGSAGAVNVYSTKPGATADTLITSIPIPPSALNEPPAVDSVNNVVYIPNNGPSGNSVTVIDGTGTDGNGIDIVNATVGPLPGPPLSIAVDPNVNQAFVAISNGQAISVLNGPTPGTSGIRGPAGINQSMPEIAAFVPSALAVDTKNDIVYVRCFCLTAPSPNLNYSIEAIDAKTDSFLYFASEFIGASTSLATDSIAVDETSGHVVIAATETAAVHVWVPGNSAFQTYSPGFTPRHVIVDSNNEVAYVTDGYGNSASVNLDTFDAFSLSQATVNVNTCSASGNEFGVDPSTDQAYMTTCGTETGAGAADLNLIDGPTGKTIAALSLGNPVVNSALTGSFSVAVDPSSHVVYVGNSLTNSINVFNGPTPGPRPVLAISPATLTFSPTQLQSQASGTLTLSNNGTAPLTALGSSLYSIVNPVGGNFQVQGGTCGNSLGAGDACTLSLTATPTALGSFSGSISFSDNALDTPQSVSLSGSGIAGTTTVSFSPDPLNFGLVPETVSTSLPITVSNAGTTQPLIISSVAFTSGSPDFSEVYNCPSSAAGLAPGASCTITVYYSPTATDTVGATEIANLQVTDNVPGSPQNITVSGISVSSQNGYGTFSQTSVNFGDIEFGELSSTQQITMTNSGAAALTISGIAVTGTNALDFPESDTCNGASLAQHSTCQINISFMPSSTPITPETAQIAITDSSPSGTQTIPLSGTSSLAVGPPSSLPELVSADNSAPPNPANPGNGNYAVSPGTASPNSGGQFVAFSSQAVNLPGPAESSSNAPLSGVYVRTTCVGASSECEQSTQFVAFAPSGATCGPNGTAYRGNLHPLIDSTGEFVAFTSDACQFTGITSSNSNQIYLRSLKAGTTSMVSLDSNGNPFGTGIDSTDPPPFSMSANAQFFAFQTTAANVVSGVGNSGSIDEVYWSNTCTGQTGCTPVTQLVSQDPTNSNNIATNTAEEPSISPDGRYVAYASTAGNLTATFIPVGSEQAYLRDTCYGAGSTCVPTTMLISQDSLGNAGNGGPNGSGGVVAVGAGGITPAVSAGGRFVAFVSSALNLIPHNITPSITSNGSYVALEQVYLRDTCFSNGVSVCQNPSNTLLSQFNGFVGSAASTLPAISADGRFITFTSSAQLNSSVPSGRQAIYEYDTCQSDGVAVTGTCVVDLYVIWINPSGVSSSGGGTAAIDATDQYISFNEGFTTSSGYPASQVYLGDTTAGQSAPTLDLIQVAPATLTIAMNGQEPFAAVGIYSNGSQIALQNATWASSATGVATVNASGVVTGVGAGTTTITASQGSISGFATLTVSPPLLSSVTLNPTSVTGGSTAAGTVTLASAAPAGGVVIALSSSNTAVATVPASVTVAPSATTATFTVTTVLPATTIAVTISATNGGTTQTALLTVNASLPPAVVTDNEAITVSDTFPDVFDNETITVTDKVKVTNLAHPTTTKVTTSVNPSLAGEAVTFTATVSSVDGPIPDGETVAFDDGKTQLGTGTTSGGIAKFQASSLSARKHTIHADYPGDANFKLSSGYVVQVVNPDPTTTVLSSSPNPSNYGALVTLSAVVAPTVSGPAPTGTVTFYNGTTKLGTGKIVSSSEGQVANLITTAIPFGSNSLTASYGGNAENGTSISQAMTQTVSETTTTLTLTSAPDPSKQGHSVEFTVKFTTSNGALSGGTITFSYGGNTLGTAITNGKGIAIFSTSALPTGTDTVTATYAGSVDYSAASATVTQTVN
jgi:hypothetical protein